MAKIAEIEVGVSARTKGYESGLERASKKTKAFNREVNRASKGGKNFDTMLMKVGRASKFFVTGIGAAAAAVGGMVAKLREMAKAQRELEQRAGQFGMNPRRLKAITVTMQNMGIEADTTIDAIQTINERVQEARQGEGTAVDVFKALSINVEKFAKLDVGQKFQRLAKAFNSIDDSAKKTLASTDLFGDEAAKIAGVLQDSAEFSKQLKTNLAEVRIDKELTKNMQRFDNAIGKLGRETGKFLSGLAPLVEKLTQGVELLTSIPDVVTNKGGTRRGKDISAAEIRRGRPNTANAAEMAAIMDIRHSQEGRIADSRKFFGGARKPKAIDRSVRTERGLPVTMRGGRESTNDFKISGGLSDLFPDLKSNPRFQTAGTRQKAFDSKQAFQTGASNLSGLGRGLASAIMPALKTLATTGFAVGPQSAAQEANAALTKGSLGAFSAVNRAANPQQKLDEQRNTTLEQIAQNGQMMLQKIGGSAATVVDAITW